MYTKENIEYKNPNEQKYLSFTSFSHKCSEEVRNPIFYKHNTKVTGGFRDCLTRQVAEGVAIRRCKTRVLNSKSEWHQRLLWKVQSEIEQG